MPRTGGYFLSFFRSKCIDLFPVIEPEFAFFQVKEESFSTYTTEPIKPGLCTSPKALDAIDMRFLISEFIVSMLNTKMLFGCR